MIKFNATYNTMPGYSSMWTKFVQLISVIVYIYTLSDINCNLSNKKNSEPEQWKNYINIGYGYPDVNSNSRQPCPKLACYDATGTILDNDISFVSIYRIYCTPVTLWYHHQIMLVGHKGAVYIKYMFVLLQNHCLLLNLESNVGKHKEGYTLNPSGAEARMLWEK